MVLEGCPVDSNFIGCIQRQDPLMLIVTTLGLVALVVAVVVTHGFGLIDPRN